MSSPAIKPSDIKINMDLIQKCGYCLSDALNSPVQKYYLNQKVSFCSFRCFELYSSEIRARRLSSSEYNVTPHPGVIKAALAVKQEEQKK